MAARGNLAKENFIKKLRSSFGRDFVGEVNKKVYVWSEENGERIQIALTLTCPKVPVEADGEPIPEESHELDFENMSEEETKRATEITREEQETIAELMARLGL